jgi:hypothetical protein
VFGGLALEVDGAPVSIPDALAYRSFMLSGVPNFAYAIGYTNSSWTLKVDLVCERFCRMLAHMDAHGHAQAVPVAGEAATETRPLLDFSAGYVSRSLHELPRLGTAAPCLVALDPREDERALRREPIEDGVLRLSPRPAAVAGGAPALPLAA